MAREPYVPCPLSGRDCRTAWREGKFKKGVWKTSAATVRLEPSTGTTVIYRVENNDGVKWTLYVEDATLVKKHKDHKRYWNV